MNELEWWRSNFDSDPNSGSGFSPNVSYRADGRPTHGDSQDQTFCIRSANEPDGPDIRLFGLFNGFQNGRSVAHFAAQRMVSEILLSERTQIVKDMAAEDVTALLRQSFVNVETAYWNEISEPLARRCMVKINKEAGPYDEPELKRLNLEIAKGTTAMVAVIIDDRLYVANCGNSRAILVHEVDEDFELFQLSTTHDSSNPDEQKRLTGLGVHPGDVTAPTRCIGDYFRKDGYKESEALRPATSEPVVCTPSVAMPVDDSFRFLALASSGVFETLVDCGYDKENANEQLVIITAQELAMKKTSSLSNVAQAVVDSISRMHQDLFQRNALPPGCRRREDMALVLILFSQSISLDTRIPISDLAINDEDNEVAAETLPLDENGCIAPYVSFEKYETSPDKKAVEDEIKRVIDSFKTKSIEEEDETEETVMSTTL